jgi:hypothetical protein
MSHWFGGLRFGSLVLSLLLASQANAISVRLAAPTSDVRVGSPFSVGLYVDNLNGQIVSAFDLSVLFNPSAVAFNGFAFGSMLGDPNNDAVAGFTAGVGNVEVFEVSLLPSDSALLALQGGSSVLLGTFRFGSMAAGPTTLGFDTSFYTLSGALGPGTDIPEQLTADFVPATINSVPEPSTLGLLAAGLGALWLTGLRRRRRQSTVGLY